MPYSILHFFENKIRCLFPVFFRMIDSRDDRNPYYQLLFLMGKPLQIFENPFI